MNTTLFKNSKLHLALVAALGVTLVACGGNSSGGGVAALGGVTNGIAVDGPLTGSTACLDTNDNKICDTGEPTATTTAGKFSFAKNLGSHMVIVSGGTDDTTGAAFTGTLKAPAGATTASPLTTMLADNPGMTPAALAAALGLPPGTNVLTADPTVDNTLMAAGTAVQQLVNQITAQIIAAGGTGTAASIQAAVSASIATSLAAPGASLTTGAAALVTAAFASAAPTIPASVVTAASTSIGASVQSIAAATTPAALAGLAQTANNTTFSSTGGITNVVAGAGTYVLGSVGAPVLAAAATAGGTKSATVTGPILGAALAFGATSGVPVISNPISIGFNVVEALTSRKFQGVISGLTLTPTGTGATTVYSISSTGAAGTIYGMTASGNAATATMTTANVAAAVTSLSTVASGVIPAAPNGGVQLNIQSLLSTFINAQSNVPGVSALNTLKGTFNVTVAVSGVNQFVNQSGVPVANVTPVTVTGSTATIAGQGETIAVTVQ